MKKTVKYMLTAFRDGFQSVVGARVLSKDFLPCVEEAYAAGVRWFEAGGGARFQSCYFYCQEDAFDVMDAFRKAAPEADLQTLSRGVNVVGLESQPSDMIKLHAQMFKKHGMSSIRNFDALNDVNNLKWSGQCIHDAGLNHEVVVTMMGLPPGIDNKGTHTPEFYRDRLKMIMDAGIPFDRVAFKDASGTSTPATVYNTMKLARQLLGDKVHIQFHSHETAGNGVSCYLAALKGGADGIDLSMAPMSGGTCQPDIITMWHCLDGDPDFCFDFDINKIKKAEDSFKNAMKKYFLPPEAMNVNPQIVWSPMPGGALTANTQILRASRRFRHVRDAGLAVLCAAGDPERDVWQVQQVRAWLCEDGAGLLRQDACPAGSGDREEGRRVHGVERPDEALFRADHEDGAGAERRRSQEGRRGREEGA